MTQLWKAPPFTALCLALGAAMAPAQSRPQGSWAMKAPIPVARNGVPLAAVAGNR